MAWRLEIWQITQDNGHCASNVHINRDLHAQTFSYCGGCWWCFCGVLMAAILTCDSSSRSRAASCSTTSVVGHGPPRGPLDLMRNAVANSKHVPAEHCCCSTPLLQHYMMSRTGNSRPKDRFAMSCLCSTAHNHMEKAVPPILPCSTCHRSCKPPIMQADHASHQPCKPLIMQATNQELT